MRRKILISEICEAMMLQYTGNDIEINGLNLCNRVSLHDRILSYVTNTGYVDSVQNNPAVVCIVLKESDLHAYQPLNEKRQMSFIVCENPEEVFYDIHDYLYFYTDFYEKKHFPPEIGENCSIHPRAVIEDGVVIGKSVVIGPNTVICKGSVIKDNAVIGCNTTIGSEGFQIIRIRGKNKKIVHCGGVVISENACIGDNTAICNALFEGETYVGENAKIDNLVYVGHNGHVGENAVVTAGTILCGSCVVDNDTWIGVNSSVLNKVVVGCGSKVGMGSVVTRDVPEDSLAYGVPAKVQRFLGGQKDCSLLDKEQKL